MAWTDLATALALILIIEGLLLLTLPGAWRQAVLQLIESPDAALRRIGAIMVACGLIALAWVRS